MGHCSRNPGAERRRFFELHDTFAPIAPSGLAANARLLDTDIGERATDRRLNNA